jgi:hypothetical protein
MNLFFSWFPKDVDNTPELEMTLAIKNAKVSISLLTVNDEN